MEQWNYFQICFFFFQKKIWNFVFIYFFKKNSILFCKFSFSKTNFFNFFSSNFFSSKDFFFKIYFFSKFCFQFFFQFFFFKFFGFQIFFHIFFNFLFQIFLFKFFLLKKKFSSIFWNFFSSNLFLVWSKKVSNAGSRMTSQMFGPKKCPTWGPKWPHRCSFQKRYQRGVPNDLWDVWSKNVTNAGSQTTF